jgi:acetyl-CoA C-acetyltransferase
VTAVLPDWTPVLVGAGQLVQREAGDASPMTLASMAAARAVADCGVPEIVSAIDTICVTRLFSDTGDIWPCEWGRSDNPPQSVAAQLGATPKDRIYSVVGGDQPQSCLIEFAQDIARGEREVVLLTGAEAIKNQRYALREERQLDWNESFSEPLMDRGFGPSVTTSQELENGLHNVSHYYSLIEQAQRQHAGRTVEQHREHIARLLASFSAVASENPYAQFASRMSAADILGAPDLTDLYTRRMIAQDGVNQGAALLLCNIATARKLGIPEANWVFPQGMAGSRELEVSRRPDLARSPAAEAAADRALEMAQLGAVDIQSFDIYSCFPCAVTAMASHLDLPQDGSIALTTTGGLPYFGGPGNNYSMHALVEAVCRARQRPGSFHMVTANGGMLSKHAVGIYSTRASTVDWRSATTTASIAADGARDICDNPGSGKVVSYTVHFDRKGRAHAIVLADTASGQRFIAVTAKQDSNTAAQMLQRNPIGQAIKVHPPVDGRLDIESVTYH